MLCLQCWNVITVSMIATSLSHLFFSDRDDALITCSPVSCQPKTEYLNDNNSLLGKLNIRKTELYVKQNRPQAPSFHAEKYIGSDRDSKEGQ